MKNFNFLFRLKRLKSVFFLNFLLSTILAISFQASAQQFKAIVFTKAVNYHHTSISDGVAALEKLSKKHYFSLEWEEVSKKIFNDEKLADVDVVIFLNTSGDVLNEAEQEAFKKFIQSGKGYVGIHGASSTEINWEWYTRLVGRIFHVHPQIQTGKLNVNDRNFPGMESLPDNWYWTEEWYEFGEEKVEGLNYLLTVDESTFDTKVRWDTKSGDGMGDFHPIAWYHEFDGGRSFYTSLGHVSEGYEDTYFLSHIYGGIYWAAKGGKHKPE